MPLPAPRTVATALLLAALATGCTDDGGASELPALPAGQPPAAAQPDPTGPTAANDQPSAAAEAEDDRQPSEDPEPSQDPTASAETSEEPPIPTPDPGPAPVPVDPPAAGEEAGYTEAEYRAIYEDFNHRVGLITTRPGFDPQELGLYISGECPCFESFLQQFQERSEAGEVVDGEPITVLSFDLEEVRPDGTFVARVIDQRGAGRVLDEAGNVLEEYEGKPPFESRAWLKPNPEGWQLVQLQYLTEESASDSEQPS